MTRTLVIVTSALLAATTAAAGQRAQPPLALESLAGRDSFAFYCASCHGPTGRGDGPVAPTLRMPPADLSTLALHNSGAFPRERVLGVISGAGRPPAAHGSTDMPVWGPIFSGLDPSAARNRQRLANIVGFIETLQRQASAPGTPGATLFRVHCAACHGTDARGMGPMADQLRTLPPDLTRFAARNGGVFPRDRVYQIVDGRGIAAHGLREMPVWGEAFRRSPDAPTDAAVTARIEAIVGYLEAIQQRATD